MEKYLKYFIIISCYFLFNDGSGYLFSQGVSFNIENIVVDHQLNNNQITSIIQDSDGFILFGTKNGIFRYDGVNSQQIYYSSSCPLSNHIACFYKDKKGYIWAGADQYILFWDEGKRSFNRINLDSLFKQKHTRFHSIKKIDSDDNGNILIFTDFYIFRLHPDKKNADIFSFESMTLSFDSYFVNQNYILAFSRLGFLRIEKSNIKQDEINIQLSKIKSKSQANPYLEGMRQITGDREGYALVSETKGLNYLSFKNNVPIFSSHYDKALASSGSKIKILFRDRDRNYWFVTYQNTLFFYNSSLDKPVQVFENSLYYSQNTTSIECISDDYSGNIWIGLKNGLSQKINLVEPKVDFIDVPKNEKSTGMGIITSLKQDKEGIIWISTNTNIYSYHDNSWHKEKSINFPASNIAPINRKIEFDETGKLWALTGNTIWILEKNGNTRMFYNFINRNKKNPEKIKNFVLTKKGLFFISNKLYAVDYNGHVIKTISSPDNSPLLHLYKDKTDILWVIGVNKIFPFDINSLSFEKDHIEAPKKKNPVVFQSIICDSLYNRWVTTIHSGLFRIIRDKSNNKWEIEKEIINPLLDDAIINDIQIDDENYLWLGTNQLGLWKYNPKTSFIKNIDIRDVNKTPYFSRNASTISADGKIYFGSHRGFYLVNTKYNTKNKNATNLVFINFNASSLSLSTDELYQLKELYLPQNSNSFSFECSLLDFLDHKRNFYFCKLEGYDTTYQNMGNNNHGYYSNLSSGSYILKIRALNSNGIYSNDSLCITIYVPTPTYRTWWAISSYLLFITLIVFSFNQYKQKVNLKKIKQMRSHSKEYVEFQESERSRISKELHDSVNQVLSFIKMKLSSMHDSIDEKSINDIIKVEKLLDDTNMEIRRISHNLHPIILDDLGLQGGLNNLVRTTKEQHDIDIEFQYINLPPRLNKDIQINIYRIIQEGLNNIIKHSGSSTCFISVSLKNNIIEIKIEDNGKGCENGNFKNGKISFGLRNMQERATFFSGKFNIESAPGKGVKILIQIPYYLVNDDKQYN